MPIPVLPEITKSSARRLSHQHFKRTFLLIPGTDLLFEIPMFRKSHAVTYTAKLNSDKRDTRSKLCFNTIPVIRIINFQSYVDRQV